MGRFLFFCGYICRIFKRVGNVRTLLHSCNFREGTSTCSKANLPASPGEVLSGNFVFSKTSWATEQLAALLLLWASSAGIPYGKHARMCYFSLSNEIAHVRVRIGGIGEDSLEDRRIFCAGH